MTNTDSSGGSIEGTRAAQPTAPVDRQDPCSAPELLHRVKGGDREALQALLVAVRPRLVAVALRMVRDGDDAQDVVQEALMKICRHVGRFEGRASLSTWLHRIVVNTALDHLRARRAGVSLARATAGAGDDQESRPTRPLEGIWDETPEDLLARAQISARVRGGMARLTPVQSQVLALRELEGESYQSIAAAVRCPVGTVMSRLHHARHRLAETLASDAPELVRRAA